MIKFQFNYRHFTNFCLIFWLTVIFTNGGYIYEGQYYEGIQWSAKPRELPYLLPPSSENDMGSYGYGNPAEEARRKAEDAHRASDIVRQNNERDDAEKAEKHKQEENKRQSEWKDRQKREAENRLNKLGEEFERVKAGMAINDSQLDAADRTSDLLERYRVRRDIINKSAHAAEFVNRFTKMVRDWNNMPQGDYSKKIDHKHEWDPNKLRDKTEEYRNYQKYVEQQLRGIRADIYQKLADFKKENASNDAEIEAADRTHDLNQRLDVRRKIIERVRTAADYAHRFTTIADEAHDVMRLFRDYQHHVERQLPAIEKDLEKENRRKAKNGQPQAENDINRPQQIKDKQKQKSQVKEKSEHQAGPKQEGQQQDKGAGTKTEKEQETSEHEAGQSPKSDGVINAEQVAQELRNVETMFNGQIAPDMDSFNKILTTLTSGEAVEGNEESLIPLDPSMTGNYIMASYKYRDERFGVSMDIGHMAKFWDAELDYTDQSYGTIHLKGVNVDASGKITFAFKGEDDNVIIRSDFGSIQNYNAQKTIEEAIFLKPSSEHTPNMDPNNLPIWGLEWFSADKVKEIISMIVDFVPLLGSSKAGSELFFGVDAITGRPISRLDVACGIVLGVVGAKPISKLAGDFVAMAPGAASKGVRYIQKGMEGFFKAPEEFIEAGYRGASRYFVKTGDKAIHVGEVIQKLNPKVQEQLKHVKIPEKALVPNGGLINHEYLGGHTIEKHVGKSNTELTERMAKEAPRKSGKPRHFSSFNNLEEAEYFVAETLKKNEMEIQEWLKNAVEPKRIEQTFGQPIGKLLKESENEVIDVFTARVILKPDITLQSGYRILTAHPVN